MSLVCGCDKKGGLSLCSKCKDLKPYTVFRFNPDCHKPGEEDKCCGVFWGSGQSREELVGKKITKGSGK